MSVDAKGKARKVFMKLRFLDNCRFLACKTLRGYSDLYLTSDVLLLAKSLKTFVAYVSRPIGSIPLIALQLRD